MATSYTMVPRYNTSHILLITGIGLGTKEYVQINFNFSGTDGLYFQLLFSKDAEVLERYDVLLTTMYALKLTCEKIRRYLTLPVFSGD